MENDKHLQDQKDDLNQILELGTDITKTDKGNIYTLTIIGQVEGHQVLPENVKTTKYEHVLPTLWIFSTPKCKQPGPIDSERP